MEPLRILALVGQGDRPEAHLLVGLRQAGVDLHVVCNPASPHQPLWEAAGIPVTPIACPRKIHPPALAALRRLLTTEDFQIAHAFNNRTLVNLMVASTGIRVRRIGYCGTMEHLRRYDLPQRLTFYSTRLHRIMCVSNAVRNYLASEGIVADRLTTIYKGHDPAWYAPGTTASREEFGIPSGSFVAGCVANVRPVKGVDVLVRALQQAPTVHALLVGEEHDHRLRRLAAERGVANRVHFAGFRPDAPALIRACDVAVMPSRRGEGLPKAVIEAMAQEVPVIVSDAGGMPELVVNGQSGWVVPASDPVALGRALADAAAHPDRRAAYARRGRKRMEARFHIRHTIERVLALYRAVTDD